MNNSNFEIIVIGAGISGLTAAKELLESGKKVALIEGRDRIGGRIKTLEYQFSQPIDAGAEFIHGDLPYTKQLAKKAGVSISKKKGKLYKYDNGIITQIKSMIEDYKELIAALKDLKTDMPLSEFLKTEPICSDEKAKRSAIRMAEGFDVADITKISAFAVRDEWKEQGTIAEPYVLKGGYGKLVNYLYQECIARGCRVFLSSPVTSINWGKGSVKIRCGEQNYIEGEKIIVTVPLGILTTQETEKNHIRFLPPVPDKINAAKKIGYGAVVKVILEFKKPFWDHRDFKNKMNQMPDLAFFITDSVFPTWWTHPSKAPVITAWAGGSKAEKLKSHTPIEIFEQALAILATIFSTTAANLNEQLVSYKVIDWGSDPFSMGAYSYDTPETEQARKLLREPLENTLFFCGEALDDTGVSGTVEAGIASAKQLVKLINEISQKVR